MLTKSVWTFVCLLIAGLATGFLAAGCRGEAPILPAVTATPTATPSITPTFNATESYQATLLANQTQNALNGLTREAVQTSAAEAATAIALTPTATPSPTMTPTPLAVMVVSDTNSLQLSRPNFEIVARLALDAEQISREQPDCSYGTAVCLAEYFSFHDALYFLNVLNFEFTRPADGEPTEFQKLFALLTSYLHENENRFKPEIIQTLMLNAFVDHLNSDKSINLSESSTITEDWYSAVVWAIELDPDPHPEWLISVKIDGLFVTHWVVLDQTETGFLKLIQIRSNDNLYPLSSVEVKVEDFTGDLIDDVVFIDAFSVRGAGFLNVSVFQGSANRLIPISNRSVFEGSYLWVTDPSTGLSGIEIATREFWTTPCVSLDTFTYYWPNGVESSSGPHTEDPITIDCAIAWGVLRYNSTQPLEAIIWFQFALAEDEKTHLLTPEDRVLIYFHLALLYARTGDDALARSYLNRIHAMASAGETEIAAFLWAEIAQLLSEEKILPLPLCLASMKIALPVTTSGPPFWEIISYPYLGLPPEGYHYALCRPNTLEQEILSGITPDTVDGLREALNKAGFPFIDLRAISLNKSRTAWFLLYEKVDFIFLPNETASTTQGYVLYGRFDDEGWILINTFNSTYIDELTQFDWTGDGIEEIGIAAEEIRQGICGPGTRTYSVVIISQISADLASATNGWSCYPDNSPFYWEFLMQDANHDGVIDWVHQRLFDPSDDLSLLSHLPDEVFWIVDPLPRFMFPSINPQVLLRDLDRDVLMSQNLVELRSELEFYLGHWIDRGDTIGILLNAHLRYLLALTYELNGDETRVVEIFYDLWKTYPETLWGQLAAARLELKP